MDATAKGARLPVCLLWLAFGEAGGGGIIAATNVQPQQPTSSSAARQRAQQTALVIAERSLWLADGDEVPELPDLVISELPGGGQRYRCAASPIATLSCQLCFVLIARHCSGPPPRLRSPELTVDIGTADDKQSGLGSHVWGSSFAAITWLARPRNRGILSGKKVLELGCGLGLTGVVAASMTPPPASVLLTDLDDTATHGLINAARRNLKRNVPDNVTASAVALDYDWCADDKWRPSPHADRSVVGHAPNI